MLLREQLEQALDQIADTKTSSTAPNVIELNAEPCQIACEVTVVGTLGCAIQGLSLLNESMEDKSIEQLQKVADGLARKLTYLLEPVSTIEVDSDDEVVQMRSDPPHREDDQRSYYELLVRRGGHLDLRRYQKNNGGVRQQVPAQFTREVLARLITDCVAALTEQ